MKRNNWVKVSDRLFSFRDSCVVWALATGDGMLVVNAGTGLWLAHVDQLPEPPKWLACTHFFRDHTAGAKRAAERGIEIWASHWEREQLSDPEGLFSRYESYIIYENKWDLFSPIEAVPVTRWLMDWETFTEGEVGLSILPLPGVAMGAIGVLAEIDRTKILFGGELIHAPGKVYRVAPLQYSYNDFTGASELKYAIGVARKAEPDMIAPSTSERVIESPSVALDQLEQSLRFAFDARSDQPEQFDRIGDDHLDKITPHIFQSRYSVASSYFLISESGKAMAIDYGYHGGLGFAGFHHLYRNRRAFIHGVDALKRDFGIEGIDTVLVTHFHDDHVMGIPMLQRLYGTRCLAGENLAHLLADPEAYAFPCTWPEPISVEAMALHTPFRWEEYEFTLYPMSGHTRFSTLISFEADGERVVATGDQYFFRESGNPIDAHSMHNHVYRNGAELMSFRQSNALIENIRPTVLLPGHGNGYYVPPEFYVRIAEYADEYEKLHADLMPLGADDLHAEVDSRMGWLSPYRCRADSARELQFSVHVRNPYPTKETLIAQLVGPAGWHGEPVEIELQGREQGEVTASITPPDGVACRRTPIALELAGPERPFGQVAEALVTVGYPLF